MLIRLLDNAPIGATPGERVMSSRSEVRSLSVGVHHRWEPCRIFGFVSMADLTAYIDESGTHGGSPLTIMAGFIGYAGRWDAFEHHWRTILTDNNVEYIHAIEVKHGNGQFSDRIKWPGKRRANFAAEVSRIPLQYARYSLSVILNNSDYDQFYVGDDKKMRKRRPPLDSKYGVCCRIFMYVLARFIAQFEDRDSQVQLVFEAGHKNSHAPEAILSEMYESAPEIAKYISPNITYALKKKSTGVQAADMIAYPVLMIERDGVPTISKFEEGVPENFPNESCPAFRIPIRPNTLEQIKSGQYAAAQLRRGTGRRPQ
jgi:hypothetical protein